MITVRIIRDISISILAAALIVLPFSTALAAPPWEDLFFNPCPETRGAWTFSTEKLNMDKYIPGGYGFIPSDIAQGSTEKGAWRSGGANQSIRSWTGAFVSGDSGAPYRVISAFSFGNDISTWLAPPEGKTRNIKYSVLQQYLPDLNNADILEIDENQIEMMRIPGAQTAPPSGNLGLVDPYKGADRNITGFDFNAGLAPDRFGYNHTQAISSDFDNPYITGHLSNQTAEDIYCSLGKTGKFNPDGTLRYGVHAYMLSMGGERRWGVENGSGFSAPGEGTFDAAGDVSGEAFSNNISMNPSNDRWWGDVVIGGTTYTMYLEDTDGSIKSYESGKYPQDSNNPGDPDAASGYPIRWHDDYELQESHPGLDLGATTYGENGRYIAERSENAFWETHQAEVHEADVLAEVRTYDPYGNPDGPTSPYEWVFDGSGDMHEPLHYYEDPADPQPYAGQWNSDTVQERAVHLIGAKGSWTEQKDKLPTNGGTPPDEEHNWEYKSTTERRGIEMPDGPPDTEWQWEDVFTGVLQETGGKQGGNPTPPSLQLPEETVWGFVEWDPEDPNVSIWETRDATVPTQTIEVTDWRAPEYNWRTFEGYGGFDQHPAYPDDDHGSSYTEWEWDPGSETWSSHTVDDIEHNEGKDGTDWKIGANWENGVVERTVFEHAVRLAELMLYPDGQRPFEDLGYVWDTEAGCVAEESLAEDDFLWLGNPLKLPQMVYNSTTNAWVFPESSGNASWFKVWGFLDHPEYTPVADYEALNDFMRYVFDIDAVVVQDINGNGHFDEGVDYILFSVRDDGLFTKMLGWDNQATGIIYDTPYEGQFFDGDTIFLYDGLNVITYFDPGNGVFFGENITPLPTFWSGALGAYELDGLDIGVGPEPGSILLIVGAGFGLVAGLIRKKVR